MSTTVQALVDILKAHGWVYDGDKGAYLSPGRTTYINSSALANCAQEGCEVEVRHLVETTAQFEKEAE